MNQRAITYRRLHDIPADWGTAVNVQAMVFGNMGDDCATGVAFTRNPSTGANEFYGEYLVNAQGEDVVAGIRTPQHLTIAGKQAQKSTLPAMEEVMPKVFGELDAVRAQARDALPRHAGHRVHGAAGQALHAADPHRQAHRRGGASKIAVDMAADGVITREEAVQRIEPASLDQLLHPTLDPKAPKTILARGLPASPGAASGVSRVLRRRGRSPRRQGRGGDPGPHRDQPRGHPRHARRQGHPDDARRHDQPRGGGGARHGPALRRRRRRSPHRLQGRRPCASRGQTVKAGDIITINGSTGEVMLGEVPTIQPELSGDFATLMGWADEFRTMSVRANADTPIDARTARRFGAEGIGLCRTEHMFFDDERIIAVREMIMADDSDGRRKALAKILPMQRGDFVELFRIMKGLPVTIRLLDPPLHEFLPKTDAEMQAVATATGKDLSDDPPARRGPAREQPDARPSRLPPRHHLAGDLRDAGAGDLRGRRRRDEGNRRGGRARDHDPADRHQEGARHPQGDDRPHRRRGDEGDPSVTVPYMVGTMIELPRAVLAPDEIAKTAEFFSFGTNDLTQTSFGLSRDDAGSFLGEYQKQGIFEHDPFVTIDRDGVGELMRIGVERGRRSRKDLKLGICGEHGGDPASVRFCHEIGLDYVSCSPYRVPIARLAAAQAALSKERADTTA